MESVPVWCAKVNQVTGFTRHNVAAIVDGELAPIRDLPPAHWLELTACSDCGFMLDRFTDQGEAAGDTWHETFEDAMDQAWHEYQVRRTDWVERPDRETDMKLQLP